MRRVAVLVAFVVLGAAAVAASAQGPGFRYGVAAGEVTSTSAAAVDASAGCRGARARGASARRANGGLGAIAPSASARRPDGAVRRPRPPARHALHVRVPAGIGRALRAPSRRRPRRARAATVRFAISGDADATPAENGRPAYSFAVYARMAAERNDFNINIGDTIYSDSGVGGAPVARTTREKWEKYKLALGQRPLRALRGRAGLYSHWDDHEFVNDFSRPEHGEALYRAGVEAFRDYSPVTYSPRLGLYRSVRWGRNLELFFLDERSFRSAKVTGACGGDLAPTAPQAVRNAFGTLAPSLRNPVPAACLAAIDDPSRTMLGARQFAAFTKAVAASTATWKVVVNEVPMQQYYTVPYDRWEGYAAERDAAPPLPAGERAERRLPHDRHPREPRERDPPADARRPTRGDRHVGGRDRAGGDEHLLDLDRPPARGPGRREAPSRRYSSSPSLRTASACAARLSTSRATRR